MRFPAHLPILLLAALPLAAAAATKTADPALLQAVQNTHRTPAMVARDPIRHPAEELEFFGLTPSSTVVELLPGTGYWTEILAPYLLRHGTYYVALPAGKSSTTEAYRKKLADDAPFYHQVKFTVFSPGQDLAPQGSADFVLTFRNIHNLMQSGIADAMFAKFYAALKPGGILGIEEHRGLDTVPQDPKATSGYVRQDYTIALAKKAGFELAGSSELLANPKDTKDYPKGVWTLPPTFALGAVDHAKYAAIGEADNFLLKFRKPAS